MKKLIFNWKEFTF